MVDRDPPPDDAPATAGESTADAPPAAVYASAVSSAGLPASAPLPIDPPASNAAPITSDDLAALEAIAAAIPPGPAGVDLAAQLMWLVELFIKRGQLAPGHHALVRRVKANSSPLKVHLLQVDDKRSIKGPDVDCAGLMHLCRARCCSMDVKMSKEDLDEGRLRWNYEEPYLLRKNPDTGYCERLSPEGGCCVYDDRPAACRIYDCRNDKRVWEDFEKRIPAAPPYFIVPLGEWDMPK